ncbi:uncharacterized protein I206_102748 [Kwoniella pini CBS 10737]|uniref:Uncharacterized protein n=1 Tax=Kwoniella pini CBS 10737 TaxID=1296096 RepID=A0A1B9I6A0_9TREE|nr:uncharacterized protein I206_03103 [Kwoniella pini CBS 10737]OCF51038.1 hypothetical protein I206_03103 [Kwoniella pini CBS 10737]
MSVFSSPLSDYSFLSSMDSTSIQSASGSSRRASSASQIPYPTSKSDFSSSYEFEHVFLSQPSERNRTSSSIVCMENSSSRSEFSESNSQNGSGKSSSAKRRERKKKLIAGEKERAAMGIITNRTWGSNFTTLSVEIHTPKAKQPYVSYAVEETPVAGPSTPRPSTVMANNSTNEADMLQDMGGIKRKTRRGGKRARRRAENKGLAMETSEVDEELFADIDGRTTSPTSSARTSRSGTPIKVILETMSEYSVDRASHLLDDEEDEVDGELSALESVLGTPPSKRFEGNIMNAQDAASSIDSFLSDPRNFMTIKANKLRLWQSLCIELGLVVLVDDEEQPNSLNTIYVPTPPKLRENENLSKSESESEFELNKKKQFIPKKHKLPETLTQARKLLKDFAHVNLVDYLQARNLNPPNYIKGAYQGLLYPTKSSMKKYTRNQNKFVEKLIIRSEWLEPLMKDFGVKKYKSNE